MDVSSIAAVATSMKSAEFEQQAALLMLKKALEMQKQNAALLLQAMPPLPPSPTGSAGGVIDTWV